MDLQDYNIKVTADQMEQMTNRNAKVCIMVGVDMRGILYAAHTPDIPKELAVSMLQAAITNFKNGGMHTIIENGPIPGPKLFIK